MVRRVEMSPDLVVRISDAIKGSRVNGLLVIDANFNVVFANQALSNAWQVPLEGAKGRSLLEAFGGKKRKISGEYYGPLIETMDTQVEAPIKEVYIKNPVTGAGGWFLISTFLIRDEQGAPQYAVGNYMPIDKFKALEHKLDNVNMKIINAFCKAIGVRDEYTMRHSEKVAELMVGFAEYLKLSADQVTVACLAGMVHDIGKIGISEQILNKPGKLTDAEFEVIKRHPVKGADILAEIEEFFSIAHIVRHHHERYDGRGYPDGISGKSIPFISRMMTLCDAFDAMTSTRCYCRPRNAQQALMEIQNCAGKQFDPELAEEFVAFIEQCGGFLFEVCKGESA